MHEVLEHYLVKSWSVEDNNNNNNKVITVSVVIDHIRILSIGLELACEEANAAKSFQMQIIFNIFPRISLHCKLVPVPYWEYEYDLLER